MCMMKFMFFLDFHTKTNESISCDMCMTKFIFYIFKILFIKKIKKENARFQHINFELGHVQII